MPNRNLIWSSIHKKVGFNFSELVLKREKDDFEVQLIKINLSTCTENIPKESPSIIDNVSSDVKNEEVICWLRGNYRKFLDELLHTHSNSIVQIINTHIHNPPKDLHIHGEWREHPFLRGRFHPDYPDDVQVIVHDGGPRTTKRSPELVWVNIISGENNLFQGKVLNQPNQLLTVKMGDKINFITPEGGKYPLLVTKSYLEERHSWIIHPCNKCGLSELFDPPSVLIENPCLDIDKDEVSFPTLCGACGGIQVVHNKAIQLSKDELEGIIKKYEEDLNSSHSKSIPSIVTPIISEDEKLICPVCKLENEKGAVFCKYCKKPFEI